MGRELVYFMSDLHLGATYISDPRGHEARSVQFSALDRAYGQGAVPDG